MGQERRRFAWARSAEVLFLLVWAAVYAAASALDVMDDVLDLMVAHEDWELDELLLALTVAGCCCAGPRPAATAPRRRSPGWPCTTR